MKQSKIMALINGISRNIVSTKMHFCLRYYRQRGKFPNLKNPKDISEILIASMLSPEAKNYADYVDKYKVREYIRSKGLGDTLLEHYGVWDKPEDIEWDNLPSKFILKANNGCGNHVICKDKSKFDKKLAITTLNKSLQMGINSIESHYNYIVPKVFCEELIDTGSDAWPTDYKFTCINGEVVDIFVATDRATCTHYCTLTKDWELDGNTRSEYVPYELPEKPKLLDRMFEIAKILSADFKFVRVDLYEYQGQVYFSELTFYPWGALMYSYTNEAIKKYGELYRVNHC